MRVSVCAGLFLLSSSFLSAQEVPSNPGNAASQAAPSARVSVTFSATDSDGNSMRNLDQQSVTVIADNRGTDVLEVRDASVLPLHLGIIFLSATSKFDQQQAAAIDLAQKVLRPGKDKAFVVTAGGTKPWPDPHINWLADPADVAKAVKALDKNSGLPDLFNSQIATTAVGLNRSTIQQYSLAGGFSAFDVIWAMMKNDPRPARRAVVIFRQASAHAPGFGRRVTENVEENHGRVIRTAQAMGVAIYTIGVEDPSAFSENARNLLASDYASIHPGDDNGARVYDSRMADAREAQYAAGQQNVERLAEETGGRAWWTMKKNYSDAVAAISNELNSRYVVSFAPGPAVATGPLHPLKVQVTGAKHVSAPKSYLLQAQQGPN